MVGNSPEKSPKRVLEAAGAASEALNNLVAVATASDPELLREVYEGFGKIVDEARKLSEKLSILHRFSDQHAKGESRERIYDAIAKSTRALCEEVRLTSANWEKDSIPGEKLVRICLEEAEKSAILAATLADPLLPELSRRSLIEAGLSNRWERKVREITLSALTDPQISALFDLGTALTEIQSACSILEKLPPGSEEAAKKEIRDIKFTGLEGLKPNEFTVHFDQRELSAFIAAQGTKNVEELKQHVRILLAQAECLSGAEQHAYIDAIKYVTLQCKLPQVVLEVCEHFKHADLKDFASRILRFEQRYATGRHVASGEESDLPLRQAAFSILRGDPDLLIKIGNHLQAAEMPPRTSHGATVFRRILWDNARPGLLPDVEFDQIPTLLSFMEAEKKPHFVHKMSEQAEPAYRVRTRSYACAIARAALETIPEPTLVADRFVVQPRRFEAWRTPRLRFIYNQEHLIRECFKCLRMHGTKDDLQFIADFKRTRKLARCVSVMNKGAKEDQLRSYDAMPLAKIADSLIARLAKVEPEKPQK